MLSTRYHLFTIISIFLSLGIGIVLGGSLGQQWLTEKQHILMDQLVNRYDEQLAKNRKLTRDMYELQQTINEEKNKTDALLRSTVRASLKNRFLLVYSADKGRASRLKRMIEWAGGQVQVVQSLKYLPVQADGVVLLQDDFFDQVTAEVLSDLQLLYRVPVIVHSTTADDWQLRNIYTFKGALSEVLAEYRFLKYLGKVIPPYKEGEHDG